jgi:hypothetical protein
MTAAVAPRARNAPSRSMRERPITPRPELPCRMNPPCLPQVETPDRRGEGRKSQAPPSKDATFVQVPAALSVPAALAATMHRACPRPPRRRHPRLLAPRPPAPEDQPPSPAGTHVDRDRPVRRAAHALGDLGHVDARPQRRTRGRARRASLVATRPAATPSVAASRARRVAATAMSCHPSPTPAPHHPLANPA